MKKVGTVCWIFLFLLLYLSAAASGESQVEELKTKLLGTVGKEKIKLLAELTHALGNNAPRQVIEYGLQALELLKNSPDSSLELRLLNDICWSYHILGDYKKALACAAKGIQIAEALNLPDELSRFYNKIGVISWKSSDYTRALEYYGKAIKINEKNGPKARLAVSYNNIALVHMELGEYETALGYLLKALEIYEESKEKREIVPDLLNNLGWVHHQLKDYQKALEFYSKSLALKEKLADKHGKANILTDMGDTYRELKQDAKALTYYQTAGKLYRELEEKRGIANILNRIGLIYTHSHQYDLALRYYSEALQINRELGDKQAIAQLLLDITRADKIQGKYRDALNQAKDALALAQEIKANRLIGDILEEIADIYAGLKDFEKALAYHKKIKAHNDAFYNEEAGKKIAEMQIKYEIDKKEKEIALLTQEKNIKELELSKQRNIRNLLVAVCGLAFLLAMVIYYSYRSKVKGNLVLKEEILQHRQTGAKLREAERERFKDRNLDSIGVLAGGIAHDFNNLLSVIIGNISLAKEISSAGQGCLPLLDRAERASVQAAHLAGKLLTFSKGDLLIKKKVELAYVIEETLALNPLDSRHSLHLDFPDSLTPLYGDERQLVQVVANLLQNAGDAMPQGGLITVRAENTSITVDNKLDLSPGPFVHLSVQDNGVGIPEENIGKVFDPYFSTKGKGVQKGMGMGLAVCYSILRKHNGYITVRSEEGKGTVVDVYFPAFTSEPPPIKEEKNIPPPPQKKRTRTNPKIKVLLMDDDETIIAINRDMLETMGFAAACFREGSEAVNAYRQAKNSVSPFDIVILDIINYKGMGGKEALQHILTDDPGVRSIAISGYLRDTDIDDLKQSGFNEVLLKPYNPSQLENAINRALSHL
jgi:signal transduction histidine kinase/CheY-like chemotaxis protein